MYAAGFSILPRSPSRICWTSLFVILKFVVEYLYRVAVLKAHVFEFIEYAFAVYVFVQIAQGSGVVEICGVEDLPELLSGEDEDAVFVLTDADVPEIGFFLRVGFFLRIGFFLGKQQCFRRLQFRKAQCR